MDSTQKRSTWKKSTRNLAAAGFSFASAVLWFLAGGLGDPGRGTLWICIGLLFLAQGFIWLGLGMRARKQEL